MEPLAEALLLAAGAMIPLGGWLGRREHHRNSHPRADLLHGAVAFGGGALLVAVVMLASGGILALLLQDVIPDAWRRGHVAPTWGGIAGFSLGLAGHLWL